MVHQTQPTDTAGMEATVADQPTDDAPTTALTRGAAVGRYTVLGEVGRGAMGIVYAAYDPQLDRRVALKVLHATREQQSAQRLVREARALARFAHPNVVTVHDVGVTSGRSFIAMEFIEGSTLRDWLQAESRSTDAILEALRAAGRGLAAAHDAGLVHRDFKPHNVMTTPQGRVVVMDFGLARPAGERSGVPDAIEASSTSPDPIELEHSPALDLGLTSTGMVMGTPTYMSLEQHRGEAATPASDQYSFCVTAFEALCDERPFDGPTRMAIALAIKNGHRAPWAGVRPVPARVRRAIERGLGAEADERWPSMQALLDELEPPRRRPLGPLALTLGGLGIVSSGIVGFTLASRSTDSACANVEAPIAAVWGPAQRERLESTFAATELAYAGETAERVTTHLDTYADRWRAGRSEACAAHHLQKLQSATVYDARTRCLQRGLLELDALVSVLTEGDAAMVRRATDAVLELPDLSSCADVDALLDQTPRPSDARAATAVDAARAALVEARAHRLTGAFAEAERHIGRAEQAGAAAGAYLPLAAEVSLARAELLSDESRFPEAARALEQAHLDARRSGHRDVALRSATLLIYLTGYRLARYEEAELWSRIARAEADRVGPQTPTHALILSWTGILHGRRGDFERARAHYLEAKALYESLEVDGEAGYDAVFTNLGLVSINLGDAEAAERYLLEGRRRYEARYGRTHPRVAAAILNLANAALQRGDVPEANARAKEAVALAEAALPPTHVTRGDAHEAWARAALAAGELEQASRSIEQATPVLEAALGADHPAFAEALTRRAEIRRLQGRLEDALADATLARQTLVARFGAQDARAAEATSVLAMAQHAAGDVDRARALAGEVLEALPKGAPNSVVPRGRAHLVLAAVEATTDPEASASHRAAAQRALESSGALGAHLLGP
ncbi:MAG: serine/threonine protein kinase [Myxococcales bacterium]|nr:serine/threonine protein kinase [Myxococcales bacterium]